MASSTTIVFRPEGVRVPANITGLEVFRQWTRSDAFPQTGRIDYLAGEVDIDMSPEDVTTHGTPKTAIAATLHALVSDQMDAGIVLTDSTRLTCPEAELSAEPDVLVLLDASVAAGRSRLIAKAGAPEGRWVEIEGAADVVVECISDSSVRKDRESLFALYHRARAREYWLVDARAADPVLTILRWTESGYEPSAADGDGFTGSPVLGQAFRLVRRGRATGLVRFRLEHR